MLLKGFKDFFVYKTRAWDIQIFLILTLFVVPGKMTTDRRMKRIFPARHRPEIRQRTGDDIRFIL